MKKIAGSMHYLDDDLISGAETYQRQSGGKYQFRIKKVAVAVCIVSLLITAGVLWHINNTTSSIFVLSAYAVSDNGSLEQKNLSLNDETLISSFEIDGINAFVFSYPNQNADAPPESVFVLSSPFLTSDLKEKPAIDEKPGNIYVYFLFDRDAAPYVFSYSMWEKERKGVYDITVSIDKNNDKYYARLLSVVYNSNVIVSGENETKPVSDIDSEDVDKLLLPYLEVIDRLNEENGWSLTVPEGRKREVYDAYKGYSPDEFEELLIKEMRKKEY